MILINNNLNQFINDQITKNKSNETISVLPLPCGSGKSTFVKAKISEYLQQDKGLIVVTDSLDRMHDYAAGVIDPLAEYISRADHRKIAILESGSVAQTRKTLDHKPIVILSTQRYFTLTTAEINDLTRYDCNTLYGQRTYKKRNLIIFDETPYLLEHLIIDTKTINDIDTALRMQLDDTTNQADKTFLIAQWQTIKSTLQQAFTNIESANTDYEKMVFYPPHKADITANDANFLRLCNKYKSCLNQTTPDTYKQICAIMRIFTDGCTLISRKLKTKKPTADTEYRIYHNYFHAVIDNTDKLTDIDAQIVVLDGTADITPDYCTDYVNMADCSDFTPDLSKLTINIIDVSTSKTRLCNDTKSAKNQLDAILRYLDNLPDKQDAIFSYKPLIDRIANHYQNALQYAHFGAIKGSNDYRNCCNIAQIGLNRYPQDYYNLTAAFVRTHRPANQHDKKGKGIIVIGQRYIDNIMFNSLLSDIEQNIFRAKIRNQDNQTPVTYTLFFNVKQYAGLINKLKERYAPRNAKINIIATPPEILSVKTQNRKPKNNTATQPQLISQWLTNRKTIFKTANLLEETGISRADFKTILKRHPEIKDRLKSMETDLKGYYNPA